MQIEVVWLVCLDGLVGFSTGCLEGGEISIAYNIFKV